MKNSKNPSLYSGEERAVNAIMGEIFNLIRLLIDSPDSFRKGSEGENSIEVKISILRGIIGTLSLFNAKEPNHGR